MKYSDIENAFLFVSMARFKDLLESKGQLEAWYDFESKATEVAICDWCKVNDFSLEG